MPIFEYKCKKCGHEMEFLEKTSGSKKHKCQKCGSSALEKLFSSFAVGQSNSNTSQAGSCPTGTCPL